MKKKFYLFAATAAMLLAACSGDDATGVTENVKDAPQTGAIEFDTYSATATRAGQAGVMSTTTMQGTGFGVFAQQGTGYSNATNPANFMWNQKVTYSASAWGYTPVKYWPNETLHDSQTSDGWATSTDQENLSFFAYAPYVENSETDFRGVIKGKSYSNTPDITDSHLNEAGITSFIGNNTTGNDPFVRYQVATKPSESVDLLWGVAPTGGLSYKAVNGNTVNILEGMPLINLEKPAVDQKIKFLFKHALARLGLTVVAAMDQIAPGGTLNSEETKIAIKSITISEATKHLKTKGALNLKNASAGISLWSNTDGEISFTINAANELNSDLAYNTNAKTTFTQGTPWTGVTTKEATVIAKKDGKDQYFMVIPGHQNTQLSVTITYAIITKDDKVSGGYVETENVITKAVTINNFTNNKAYNLRLILGLTSVKLDAEVADWEIAGNSDVNLPRNNE